MSVSREAARRPEGRRIGWSRLSLRHREAIMGYVLISPWVIGFLAFTLGPVLASLGLSFFESDLFTYEFVGFKNYATLFSFDETRSLFWKSLYNTTYYVFLSLPLVMGTGFFIALLLNQNVTGQSLYRILYYLPSIIPNIAASIVWLYIFQPEFGLVNGFLSFVGIEGPRWLADPKTAKLVFVIMSMWGSGGNMLVFLAGLQSIPTELYEAATIDGAGRWHRFRHITLPMISPTIFFVLVTQIIWSFQIFTSVYVMTERGTSVGWPANSTLMYVLYLYQVAFRQYRMGYASALAWVLFVIILLLTVLVFKSSSAWVYYETEMGGGKS